MTDRASDDEEVRITAPARLIAASMCDPGGEPAITTEKARTLKTAALNAILQAVLDVNGMGTVTQGNG